MPTLPDGSLSDEDGVPGPNFRQPSSGRLGKEGRPTHYKGPRAEHVPAWRFPLRAQISALKDELGSVEGDIMDWEQRRAADSVGGADWVLLHLRTEQERLGARIRWLESEIPVDPVTGEDLDE
jgi:hypothetical protein